MPCALTSYCIRGEVDFAYHVRNTGYVCNDVQKATVKFGADPIRVLAIDRPCTDRDFCPGDEWIFNEKRYVDTCNDPFNYQIVIGIHTNYGLATSIGSWTGPSAIQPTPPKPAPPAPTVPVSVCTTEASQLIFMYHGGRTCASGHGRQRNLRKKGKDGSSKNNKKEPSSSHSSSSTTITSSITTTIISHASTSFYDCSDFGAFSSSDVVEIVVRSKNGKQFYGHHRSHKHGNAFSAISADGSCLKNNVSVMIYKGSLVQSVDVNTGGGLCLENIVNKPMGSITLIGWE